MAERLTQEILDRLHLLGQLKRLTEAQAFEIKCAVEAGAQEMHFQRKVATETPRKIAFALSAAAPAAGREEG